MLQLPKIVINPKDTEGLCKCRPVCKSRRREWKGTIQLPSAELLLERKPAPECRRRWPSKFYPNSPCPLYGRSKNVTKREKYVMPKRRVVRLCQAPIDNTVDTTYLRYAQLAKDIGAWAAVKACCAFCNCGPCCQCTVRDYVPHDEDRALKRRGDMRKFDSRVKSDYQAMRIMYEKI